MANLKISQLNDGGVAQTSDLIRIARPTGGGYLDWSTSMDDVSTYVDTSIDPVHQYEVGAAGGVPPLNGSGIIPTQYIPAMATDYLGVWNANTNSPTLSDGTGSVGEFLFVGTAGTQDLGSGSFSYAVYNIVIHNGTIWEKVPVSAAGVASWNALTGVISATTLNLPDDVDARYVTDNYYAACAGTSGTPSGTNKYVTDNDPRMQVSGGIINNITVNISGGYNLITGYGDGINDVGNNTASRRLSGLGYSNATAATQWPLTAAEWGGIVAADTEYDEVCIQEAMLTLEVSKLRSLYAGASLFLINRGGIILPQRWQTSSEGYNNEYDDPCMFLLDFQGANVHPKTSGWTSANGIFSSRIPVNDAEAQYALKYVHKICNLKMQGNGGAGTALLFRASRKLQLDNCHADDFDTGFETRFALNSSYNNCTSNNFATYGFHINSGDFGFGDACISYNHQSHFTGCGTYGSDPASIGMYIRRGDTCSVRDSVFEGPEQLAAFYWDQAACPVSKHLIIDNIHVEMGNGGYPFYADSIFKLRGQDFYNCVISNIYIQSAINQSPRGNLINLETTSGATNRIKLANINYSGSGDEYGLKATGGNFRLTLDDVQLPGNPQTAANVVDTGAYPDIWAAGSTVPNASNVRIYPRL